MIRHPLKINSLESIIFAYLHESLKFESSLPEELSARRARSNKRPDQPLLDYKGVPLETILTNRRVFKFLNLQELFTLKV